MDKSIELINYLPPVLREKEEFTEMFSSVDEELKLLYENINNVIKDRFLTDLTINGILYWEKKMKIYPKPTDTLEDRRFRILCRWINQAPYTLPFLVRYLDTMLGSKNYDLDVQYNDYILKLEMSYESQVYVEEINYMIYNIKPCNIVYLLELFTKSNVGIKSSHVTGNYVLPICNDLLVNYSYEFPVCGTYPSVIDRAYSNIQTVGLMAKALDFINEFRRCSNDESVGDNLENIVTNSKK